MNYITNITKKLFNKLDKSDKLKEKNFDPVYLDNIFGSKLDAKELRKKEINSLLDSLQPCLLAEYKFNVLHSRPEQVMSQLEQCIKYVKQCRHWLENEQVGYRKIDIVYLKDIKQRYSCKTIIPTNE